jgi:hypothetical protein
MNQRLIAAMMAAIDILRGGLNESLSFGLGPAPKVSFPKEIDPSLFNDITFVEGDSFEEIRPTPMDDP